MRLLRSPSAVVVLAALVGLAACSGGQKKRRAAPPVAALAPTLELRSVTPAGFDFEAATFAVAFDVDNPNPVALPLARLALVVEVEGAAPFAVEVRPGVALAASARTPVAVPVRLRYADIPNVVAHFGLRTSLAARATGTASVSTAAGLLPMPVAFETDLPLPRLPTFAFEGVEVGTRSALSMSFDVNIRVTNPNPFPLPAGRLGYVLKVAGSPAASADDGRIPGTPAGGTSAIAIRADVNLIGAGVGAGKAIVQAAQGNEVPVSIKGQASLAGIPIPLAMESRIRRLR